jgi:hypothetical protein
MSFFWNIPTPTAIPTPIYRISCSDQIMRYFLKERYFGELAKTCACLQPVRIESLKPLSSKTSVFGLLQVLQIQVLEYHSGLVLKSESIGFIGENAILLPTKVIPVLTNNRYLHYKRVFVVSIYFSLLIDTHNNFPLNILH